MKTALFMGALGVGICPCMLGQFALSSADMPQPGNTYPVENGLLTFQDYSLSGEGVTWDMSDIQAVGEAPVSPVDMSEASITAGIAFNNPFNAAYQCDYFLPTEFPALPDGVGMNIPIEGFNSFYQTSSGYFAIAGIGLSSAGFDLPVQYEDIDEWFPLPFAFGETFNSTASFSLNLDGLFGYSLEQTRAVEVDAWGTLILPDGPHEVLRIRSELDATDVFVIPQLSEDSIPVDREQVIYSWYGQGTGVPLLEVTEILGAPAIVTFQNFTTEPNIVSENIQNPAWKTWPNPAAPMTTLNWDAEPNDWKLYNASGQLLNSGRGNSLITPSVSGMYWLQVGSEAARSFWVQNLP